MRDGQQPLPPPDPPDLVGSTDSLDDVDPVSSGGDHGASGTGDDRFFAPVVDPSAEDGGDGSVFANVVDPSGDGGDSEGRLFAAVADPSVDDEDGGGSFFASLRDSSVEDDDEAGGVLAPVVEPSVDDGDDGGSFFAPLRDPSMDTDDDGPAVGRGESAAGQGDDFIEKVAAAFEPLADAVREELGDDSQPDWADQLLEELTGSVGFLARLMLGSDEPPSGPTDVARRPDLVVEIELDDPAEFLGIWDQRDREGDLNRALMIRAVHNALHDRGIRIGLDELGRAYDELSRSLTRQDSWWRERIERMEPGSSIEYGVDFHTLRNVVSKVGELRAYWSRQFLEGDERRAEAPDFFGQTVIAAAASFGTGVGESVRDLAEFAWSVSPIRRMVDPVGYSQTMTGLVKGLWYGVTHPVEFGKAVIDWDTWKRDPMRALGHLVPDFLGTLFSGGGVLITKVDDAGRLSRALFTQDEIDDFLSRLDDLDRVEDAGNVDRSIAVLDRVLVRVDALGAEVRVIVPDGAGASPAVVGTKRHTAAFDALRSPTAEEALVKPYIDIALRDLPGFSREISDMTVRQFLRRFGLEAELKGPKGGWGLLKPNTRIGDLELDVAFVDDRANRAIVWDLTGQPGDDRHLRKTILYARALVEGLADRIREVRIAETYHNMEPPQPK